MISTKIPRFVAIDTETTGLDYWRGHRMFAVAAYFYNHKRAMWRDDFSGLETILEDPNIDKVFHNANFDIRMLEAEGFTVKGRVWDTMIFGHLLDGRDARGGLNLEEMCKKYLPRDYRKLVKEIDDWFAKKGITGKAAKNFKDLPYDLLKKRVVGDAELTARLFQRVYATVAKTFPTLLEQEHALIPIIRRMENRGMMVDMKEVEKQERIFDEIYEDVEAWAEDLLGWDYFNAISRTHQTELLKHMGCYNQLTERTKTGRKMDVKSLLRLQHPAAYMILAARAADKMRGTFIGQIRRYQHDSILHAKFRQTGTVTGRFSCANPNLLNIPTDSDSPTAWSESDVEGLLRATGIQAEQHIKRMYVVPPGYARIHSDKVQAEMVALAHYTKDKKLLEIFAQGISIHEGMCRHLFGKYNKVLKRQTKGVVFGYVYGAGLESTAAISGGTIEEARDTRNRLSRMFPTLARYKRRLEETLREQGYVQTIHGRRCYLSGNESYMVINRMCQATIGDEVKGRMVALDDYYRSEGIDATIVLNIYDDIATDIRTEDVAKHLPEIFRIMQETPHPYRLAVPSDCSITYTRWSDLMPVAHPDKPKTYTRKAFNKYHAEKAK